MAVGGGSGKGSRLLRYAARKGSRGEVAEGSKEEGRTLSHIKDLVWRARKRDGKKDGVTSTSRRERRG